MFYENMSHSFSTLRHFLLDNSTCTTGPDVLSEEAPMRRCPQFLLKSKGSQTIGLRICSPPLARGIRPGEWTGEAAPGAAGGAGGQLAGT